MEDLLARGAQVGTAGFVLSRVLLEPPAPALAESFASPQMRSAWPLQDPASVRALESVGVEPVEDTARDRGRMFRRQGPLVRLHESQWYPVGTDPRVLQEELVAAYEDTPFTGLPAPVDDHLGFQVAHLAHLATQVGRASAADDVAASRSAARRAQGFRAAHTELFVGPVLEGIAAHARTRLYAAVPDLLRGFLAGHAALCFTALT